MGEFEVFEEARENGAIDPDAAVLLNPPLVVECRKQAQGRKEVDYGSRPVPNETVCAAKSRNGTDCQASATVRTNAILDS